MKKQGNNELSETQKEHPESYPSEWSSHVQIFVVFNLNFSNKIFVNNLLLNYCVLTTAHINETTAFSVLFSHIFLAYFG